jgi:hypothetical protein
MPTPTGDPTSVHPEELSDKEIPVINYWLDNCQTSHPDCATSEPAFMPTRVVDVGLAENQEPRLVLTADLNFTDHRLNATARRYLALSHCWGLSMLPTAITTLSTISDRLQTIPIAGLSRTFADCITIAQRMRVQYIWIDSLCIIQDSREDWEKEAAQMASVYSNAYCTVAASSSADGNGGCYVDPDSEAYGPVILTFNEAGKNGNSVVQRVRIFSTFGKPIVNVLTQDPLSKRGWTFQERELSNRILHYSHDTIRWECRSLKASLQFPWNDTNAFNGALRTFDAGPTLFSQIGEPRRNHQIDAIQKEKDQEAWFQAIDKYTGRALTKQSDKLPAFSGIARAVQACTSDRYLAGLWESNLIHCLCWYSAWHPAGGNPVFYADRPAPIAHTRQAEYISPSWSWAAINGHVRYETWIFGALDPNPMRGANARFIPRILEARTIPAGLDEYGQLKGAFVRLEGKIKPAFTRGEGFARQDREGVYDVHEGKMREVGMVKFDVPADSPVGQIKIIICLCVIPRAERYGDSVGLALVPTGRSEEYCRVGLILAVKLEWWEGCAEGAITLV